MTEITQVFVCIVALMFAYSLGYSTGRGRHLEAFLRDDEPARKIWYAAMVKNGVCRTESPPTSDRNHRDPK